jgi:hypothetical protein
MSDLISHINYFLPSFRGSVHPDQCVCDECKILAALAVVNNWYCNGCYEFYKTKFYAATNDTAKLRVSNAMLGYAPYRRGKHQFSPGIPHKCTCSVNQPTAFGDWSQLIHDSDCRHGEIYCPDCQDRDHSLDDWYAGNDSHIGYRPGLRDDPGYVYIVQCNEFFKIGKSKNVDGRVRDLQVGNPYKITIIRSFNVRAMSYCERFLHDWLIRKRINGEWFALTPDDIQWIDHRIRNELI